MSCQNPHLLWLGNLMIIGTCYDLSIVKTTSFKFNGLIHLLLAKKIYITTVYGLLFDPIMKHELKFQFYYYLCWIFQICCWNVNFLWYQSYTLKYILRNISSVGFDQVKNSTYLLKKKTTTTKNYSLSKKKATHLIVSN